MDPPIANDASIDAHISSCGAESMPCCTNTPWCGSGLVCANDVCQRPSARCSTSGIADPRSLTASIDFAPIPECADVPEVLLDAATPGTYPQNATDVGRIDCIGLTPGTATIQFQTSVRLLTPGAHEPGYCLCSGEWSVALDLVIEGGPTVSLSPDHTSRLDDSSCRDGPNFSYVSRGVPIGADGRLSARIDLHECRRTDPTNCLFERGTSLTVTQP